MQKIHKIKTAMFRIPVLTGILLAVLVLFRVQTVEAAAVQAKGIDVSRWQGRVEWEKVKKDGIEFVMLGLGRYRNGHGIPDPNYEYNIKQALAQGIDVGVYLYSEARTVQQAREEAEYVLDQIDGYRISYPVAFDIEDEVHRRMTTKQRTDITLAFLEVIEEAGYYPMVYASESWFRDSLDLGRLRKYDKWVARWAPSVSFRPLAMWQYSSTGRVEGIAGPVDLDYCYKDYSKIITPRTKAENRKDASGWQKKGRYYTYLREDGTMVKKSFLTIDGKTYYFNSKGYRGSGWQKIDGRYYYFVKNSGVMKKGWLTLSGKKYYLDANTGARKTGWQRIGGSRYYFDKKGVMKKGWLTVSGKKYFLNLKSGKMRTGWLTYQKKTYYFDKTTGVMKKGWMGLSGKKYYFDHTGGRVKKWQKISGKWYYFGPKTGAMQKNMKIGRYRLGPDGVCRNRH